MSWRVITMRDLEHAMAECDHYGLEPFRNRHCNDFIAAHNIHMIHHSKPGREYEARPLIAAAYAYHTRHNGRSIGPTDFEGNDAHNFLIGLGFQRIQI